MIMATLVKFTVMMMYYLSVVVCLLSLPYDDPTQPLPLSPPVSSLWPHPIDTSVKL